MLWACFVIFSAFQSGKQMIQKHKSIFTVVFASFIVEAMTLNHIINLWIQNELNAVALRVRHLNVQIEKKLSREKSIHNCNFPAVSNIKSNKKTCDFDD